MGTRRRAGAPRTASQGPASAPRRCEWAGQHPLLLRYHDEEWGRPSHDERRLFEMLILEGAQAGLSWLTILKKRPGYREAFAGFDPARVARFGKADERRLLGDHGIVRNRLKIASAIGNARAFLRVQEEEGGFDAYLWRFVGGRPVRGQWSRWRDVPAETPLSRRISSDLRRRGFRFVGPVIVYSFLQSVGVVDDHVRGCPNHASAAQGPGRGRGAAGS